MDSVLLPSRPRQFFSREFSLVFSSFVCFRLSKKADKTRLEEGFEKNKANVFQLLFPVSFHSFERNENKNEDQGIVKTVLKK